MARTLRYWSLATRKSSALYAKKVMSPGYYLLLATKVRARYQVQIVLFAALVTLPVVRPVDLDNRKGFYIDW